MPALHDEYAATLARTVGLVGRALLVPVALIGSRTNRVGHEYALGRATQRGRAPEEQALDTNRRAWYYLRMAYVSRVLVVASVTSTSPDLLGALRARVERSPAAFHLLMPAVAPGVKGRKALEPRLAEALAHWREAGLDVDGRVGHTDPVVAVSEAWDPLAFDEVIVSTLPGHASKWMTFDLPHRVAKITDSQVTHVVARLPGDGKADFRPVPKRERPALGPFSALSWGDRKRS